MVFNCFVALLFLFSPQYEPWGQDSDIEQPPKAACEAHPLAGEDAIIHFHQRVLSPADGSRCCFYPSCSQYMLEALRKHGFLKGFLLGCDRLLRDNSGRGEYPLYKTQDGDVLKYDPVP
jgi:putative membrane protein insertion efficiency factor